MSGLDPIELQVMIGGLRAACEEMGAALIRSSYSANIKERHDCSTALFDAAGELVMQAEHIPVHLGSMPDAVAAVLEHGLNIPAGVTFLVGENGSGKSTLVGDTLAVGVMTGITGPYCRWSTSIPPLELLM